MATLFLAYCINPWHTLHNDSTDMVHEDKGKEMSIKNNKSATNADASQQDYVIDGGVVIGHTHLKVADIERALGFWRDIIGFEITQRAGDSAVFLSAGGYHHHIGLNTWESRGGTVPAPGTTGLYHVALRYPSRPALARALQKIMAAGWPLEGAADHGVSEALYLRDPDGNGVELYYDRDQSQWPKDSQGQLQMYSRSLDVQSLVAALM